MTADTRDIVVVGGMGCQFAPLIVFRECHDTDDIRETTNDGSVADHPVRVPETEELPPSFDCEAAL
ncbi:hypothetical protein [Haladaptatus sp. NG-SE-30]